MSHKLVIEVEDIGDGRYAMRIPPAPEAIPYLTMAGLLGAAVAAAGGVALQFARHIGENHGADPAAAFAGTFMRESHGCVELADTEIRMTSVELPREGGRLG